MICLTNPILALLADIPYRIDFGTVYKIQKQCKSFLLTADRRGLSQTNRFAEVSATIISHALRAGNTQYNFFCEANDSFLRPSRPEEKSASVCVCLRFNIHKPLIPIIACPKSSFGISGLDYCDCQVPLSQVALQSRGARSSFFLT